MLDSGFRVCESDLDQVDTNIASSSSGLRGLDARGRRESGTGGNSQMMLVEDPVLFQDFNVTQAKRLRGRQMSIVSPCALTISRGRNSNQLYPEP
jgi:hypothetical protein